MIQSKPFAPTFPLGSGPLPSASSVGQTPLIPSLGNPLKAPARRPTQDVPFGRQPGAVFPSTNGAEADPSSQVPSLVGLPGPQSDISTLHSGPSGSSFFLANPFPFSVNTHGSINSIPQSSASTNSIVPGNSSNTYVKNSSITGTNSKHISSGTSNFFPNSIEDTSNPSKFTPLHVFNLPRDIKEQEFNVLFTFAPEFVFSEIQKAQSVAEDGLPTSVVGIGYFKSLPAAANALTVLTSNPHVFAPKDAVAQSSNPSPYAITCEIPYKSYQDSANNFNGPSAQPSQVGNGNGQSSQSGMFKSSRFVFPSSASTAGTSNPPSLDVHSTATFPDVYSDGLNGGVFSPTTTGSVFPGTTDSDATTRMTGKSLLLESQSKEDEEYNDLVKDPVGWLSRQDGYFAGNPGSSPGPVGFQTSQAQPASTSSSSSQRINSQVASTTSTAQPISKSQQPSQVSSRAHSPPSSSGSSISSHTTPSPQVPKSSARSTPMVTSISQTFSVAPAPATNAWTDKRRSSTTRSFQNLSISGNSTSNEANKVVVPYSPTNSGSAITIMQNGGRVLPPANPADQNPPCNTLYVGNLPPDTNEEELKELFSSRRGYKRLCFRTKANGPMCFVEFDDVSWATRALEELYGFGLSNSVKGGIRLSFSKNPLGVRSQTNGHNNSSNASSSAANHHNSHTRIGSQQMLGVNTYSNTSRPGNYALNASDGHQQRQSQQHTYNDSNASVASGYLTAK